MTLTEKVAERKIEIGDYVGIIQVWRTDRRRRKLRVKKIIYRVESWGKLCETFIGRPHKTYPVDELEDVVERTEKSVKDEIQQFIEQDEVIDSL